MLDGLLYLHVLVVKRVQLDLEQGLPLEMSKLCQGIVTANYHNHIINSSSIDAVRGGQDLQVGDQDATAEGVVDDPKVEVVEEHHPGVGGWFSIDDGGGDGDDAAPRVREAL